MRVISQDGTLDLPYEGISLERDKNVIRAGYSSVLQKGVVGAVLAEYAAEEKADRAMRMLRKSYLYRSSEDAPKVFQFPADEDLEV